MKSAAHIPDFGRPEDQESDFPPLNRRPRQPRKIQKQRTLLIQHARHPFTRH